MISDWQERTKILIGEKHNILQNSKVLVAGLGGVGGISAEMLCRAGVENLTLADSDKISLSNLNRQIFTDTTNVGRYKTDVLSEKLQKINPLLKISKIKTFLKKEQMLEVLKQNKYDFVIDAIDTLSPKVFLIYHSIKLGYNVVSSMGSGGKTNPEMVKVRDISDSFGCPLARKVRKKLHRLGVYSGFKVIFSAEKIKKDSLKFIESENKKTTHGTISYLPSVFGLYASWVVIDGLLKQKK